MKRKSRVKNAAAANLSIRAGNASASVSVDTRPKTIPNKKRNNVRMSNKDILRHADFHSPKGGGKGNPFPSPFSQTGVYQ